MNDADEVVRPAVAAHQEAAAMAAAAQAAEQAAQAQAAEAAAAAAAMIKRQESWQLQRGKARGGGAEGHNA